MFRREKCNTKLSSSRNSMHRLAHGRQKIPKRRAFTNANALAHVSSSQGSIIYRIRDGQHARTGGGRSPSRDEGLWRIHISGNAFRSATVVCLANASQNSPLKRVQYGTLQRLTQTMQDQPCDAESHPQVRRAKPNACSNVRVEQRLTVTVVTLSASHAGGPDSAFVVVQVHTMTFLLCRRHAEQQTKNSGVLGLTQFLAMTIVFQRCRKSA